MKSAGSLPSLLRHNSRAANVLSFYLNLLKSIKARIPAVHGSVAAVQQKAAASPSSTSSSGDSMWRTAMQHVQQLAACNMQPSAAAAPRSCRELVAASHLLRKTAPCAAAPSVGMCPLTSSGCRTRTYDMQQRWISSKSRGLLGATMNPHQQQHSWQTRYGAYSAAPAVSASHAAALSDSSDSRSSNNSSLSWSAGFHTSSTTSTSSSSGKKQAAASTAASAAASTAAPGSTSPALGMSSYELAAEKMSDREILGTLAQHLWPKGEQGWSYNHLSPVPVDHVTILCYSSVLFILNDQAIWTSADH